MCGGALGSSGMRQTSRTSAVKKWLVITQNRGVRTPFSRGRGDSRYTPTRTHPTQARRKHAAHSEHGWGQMLRPSRRVTCELTSFTISPSALRMASLRKATLAKQRFQKMPKKTGVNYGFSASNWQDRSLWSEH